MPLLLTLVDFTGTEPDQLVWQSLIRQLRACMPGVLKEVVGPGYLAASLSNRAASPPSLRRGPANDTLLVDCEREDSVHASRPKTPHASIEIKPGRVCLRRDWLGHRPLAYARVGNCVVVGSYDHLIMAHPGISNRKLCDDYLLCYFAQLPPPLHRSVFAAVNQVMPGAMVVLTQNSTQIDAEVPGPSCVRDDISDQQAVAAIQDSLEMACARSCEGARRIGLSLSSGIDSTSVLAFLPRISPVPLAVTFGSSHFPEMDERNSARALAAHFGIEAADVEADRYAPMSPSGERPIFPGSPYSSVYRELKMALYRRFAAGGVDTVLGGYMGDELCANRSSWLLDALRARRFDDLAGNVRFLLGGGPRALWQDLGWRSAMRRLFPRPIAPPSWIQPRWHDRYRELVSAERERFRGWPRPEQAANVFGGISALDGMEGYFAERCGLEIRQTYADPGLVDLMLTLPTSMSWRKGIYKWAVRAALIGRLPENIRTAGKCGDMSRFYDAGGMRGRWREGSWGSVEAQSHVERFVLLECGPHRGNPMAEWAHRSFGTWLDRLNASSLLPSIAQGKSCVDGSVNCRGPGE